MKALIIASTTFREALRKRIVLAAFILTLIFVALFGASVHFALAQRGAPAIGPGTAQAEVWRMYENSMFLFLGIFVSCMIGALVAIFTACGAISTEVEQGTLQSVATRPISRYQIVFGKWLGYATMLSAYLGGLFFSLIGFIYFETGWLPDNYLIGGVIFICQALVVLSVAMFGSAIFSTTANAVIVLLLYMTGLVGGMMEQIGIMIGKKALFASGVISSFIIPTDSMYRYIVVLLQPKISSSSLSFGPPGAFLGPFGAIAPPSFWILVYAFAFSISLIGGTIYIFSRKDL